VSSTNTDVKVTQTTSKAATGGAIYLSVVGRHVVGAGDYRANVRLQTNGKVGVTLVRASAAGTESTIKTEVAVAGVTYTASTNLRVRLQVTGTSPTTVRAKVWLASATEPAAWTTTVTDTTAGMQVPGGVGLVTYLSGSATNAPVVARYDNFQAGPGV
jgi:hypothetical protein